MASKKAMASATVRSSSATMSTVLSCESIVQCRGMLCRLALEPAACGAQVVEDLDGPVGGSQGAEQSGQAMRVLGDRDDGEGAHGARAMIGTDARSQGHHLLVGHRRIAARAVEQLAVSHGPGH